MVNTWPVADSGSTSRKPDRRDGGDGLVQGVEPREAEQHVADGAEHEHRRERHERESQPAALVHRGLRLRRRAISRLR